MPNKAKRILTGDRPTGPLHLGHYFGSLQNRIKLQNQGYETFIIIADYQVLTDRLDSSLIKENIFNLMLDYLAVGLDPDKTTFFIQSSVYQLADLYQVLSMLASTSRVGRNPTVKEEIKSMHLESNVSLGMFSYPVSQAADILLFNADVVPVGEDQLPHLELTKELARKFNSTYKEIFTVPEPLLSSTPRLAGLDGTQKMSKSRGNAIFLSDSTEEILAKVKRAQTDSGTVIKHDKLSQPNLANLIDLYCLVTNKSIQETEDQFKGMGYKEFKEELAKEIDGFVSLFREKRNLISRDYVMDVLKSGTKKAREVGDITMHSVKNAMGMDYFDL